jgi:hypothetical protein
MPKETKPDAKVTHTMPRDEHRRLKILAAEREVTMAELLQTWVRDGMRRAEAATAKSGSRAAAA